MAMFYIFATVVTCTAIWAMTKV